GAITPGDGIEIVQNTFSLDNYIGWAVAKNNQPLIDALNAGLDAIIADGTWAKLYTDWVPRPLPPGWKPGSTAAPQPDRPDIQAIAEAGAAQKSQGGEETGAPAPRSTLQQLGGTFFNFSLYKQAFPDLLKTGLPNTLILAVTSGIAGTIVGMLLAVAGIS